MFVQMGVGVGGGGGGYLKPTKVGSISSPIKYIVKGKINVERKVLWEIIGHYPMMYGNILAWPF